MAGSPPVAAYTAPGGLKLSVWLNEGSEGRQYCTFTFERRYEKDGEWKSTTSLRERDLLPMAALLKRAFNDGLIEQRDPSAPREQRGGKKAPF